MADVTYRPLAIPDLDRIGEIDRSERINVLYVQRGTELEPRPGDWSASAWRAEGDGEHSVASQRAECLKYLAAGGLGCCAFVGGRLVGIGLVVPHVRTGLAQLAYLHVSREHRGAGVGHGLETELERIALAHGAEAMVVSATPSENTVRFYLGCGFEPTAEPLPELFELEPDDVHMRKPLA